MYIIILVLILIAGAYYYKSVADPRAGEYISEDGKVIVNIRKKFIKDGHILKLYLILPDGTRQAWGNEELLSTDLVSYNPLTYRTVSGTEVIFNEASVIVRGKVFVKV